ncbi:hypothetical protein BBA18_RS17340, partial [Escherichia coli]
ILKNKKYLAREDNPLTRITRTVLYIYEKLHSGGGIGIPTTHCLWDRPPHQIFPPAKLKKMRHAGGRDVDTGISVSVYP